ncbi:Serine/threonine-protein kinase ATR [Hondaea fermentalgiana]|uniref:Serine/threonine-protein kinase ATR n=1 Tax=Hondaea fermentalgiana TaxID=2315210 RepID=A0A2R5GRF6_9STRA|nr:Serine/threonine-protein kinase ATR [Hondaea fermentalgiana]|eukprot:GBG33462.1 Serine/threonine-protein kinase ATR [Hondaea fermentalgiana]
MVGPKSVSDSDEETALEAELRETSLLKKRTSCQAAEIAKLRRELDLFRHNQLHDLAGDYDDLLRTVRAHETAQDCFRQDLAQMQLAKQAAEFEAQTQAAAASAMREKLVESDSRVKTLEEKVARETEQRRALKERLLVLQERLCKQENDSTVRLVTEAYERKIQDLESRHLKAQHKWFLESKRIIAKSEEDISAPSEDRADLEATKRELEHMRGRHKIARETWEAKLEAMRVKVTRLEARLEAKTEDVNKSAAAHKTELDALKGELAVTLQTLNTVSAKHEALQSTVQVLVPEVKYARVAETSAQHRSQQIEKAVGQSMQEHRATENSLRAKLRTEQQARRRAENLVARHAAGLRALKTLCKKLKTAKERAERDLHEAQDTLQARLCSVESRLVRNSNSAGDHASSQMTKLDPAQIAKADLITSALKPNSPSPLAIVEHNVGPRWSSSSSQPACKSRMAALSSAELLRGLLKEIAAHRGRHDERDARLARGETVGDRAAAAAAGEAAADPERDPSCQPSSGSASLARAGNGAATRAVGDEDKCREMLNKVRHFIASLVEHCFTVSALQTVVERRKATGRSGETGCGATEMVLMPALELVRVLLAGTFCPHARAVFDFGDVNGVLALLLSTLNLLMQPCVGASGLEPLLWDSVLGTIAVLAEGDLQCVIVLIDDTNELLEALSADEASTPPVLKAFEGICAKASAASAKSLELKLGTREARWHAKSQTNRLAGRILARFAPALAAHPAFSALAGAISDRLDVLTANVTPGSGLTSGQLRAVGSLCAAAGDILAGTRAVAPALATALRKQLLEVGRAWALRRVASRASWTALASALAPMSVLSFDADDVSLASEIIRALLCRPGAKPMSQSHTAPAASAASTSRPGEAAMVSSIPFLRLCVCVVEARMKTDIALIRIVGLFANERLLSDASMHACVARCLAHGIAAVVAQDSSDLDESTSESCTRIFTVTDRTLRNGASGSLLHAIKDPPASPAFLGTVAGHGGGKKRKHPFTSSTSVHHGKAPVQSSRVRPLARDALVDTIQWLMLHSTGLETANRDKRTLDLTCTSILLQALVQVDSSIIDLDPGEMSFRVVLNRAAKLFGNLDVTSPRDRARETNLMEIAVDTALALAFKLHGMQRDCTKRRPEHEALCKAVQGLVSIFKRESWVTSGVSVRNMPSTPLAGQSNSSHGDRASISAGAHALAGVRRVRFPQDPLAKALDLPLEERFVILAGALPCDWFATEFATGTSAGSECQQNLHRRCTQVFGARLLNGSASLRLLTVSQLPDLIRNLRIRERVLAEFCESLTALIYLRGSEPSQSSTLSQDARYSQASDGDASHGSLRTLRGFLVKLGTMMSEGGSDAALEACTASVAEICQLPITEPLDTEASKDAFECTCHGKQSIAQRALGDVHGSVLLFNPWLHGVLGEDGALVDPSSISASARVAMVKCSIDIFRRVAHIGAWRGQDTPLIRLDSYRNMLHRLVGLLESPDQHVRQAIAEDISVFVEGCGGGRQFLAPKTPEHRRDTLAPRYQTVSEDAPGRCDMLRAIFSETMQTANVSLFMKTLRQLVGNTGKRHKRQLQQGITPRANSGSVAHSLLVAVGSIGCTAEVTYQVNGVNVGNNLLVWSLLMLAQQYAFAVAWSNEVNDRASHGTETEQETKSAVNEQSEAKAKTALEPLTASFHHPGTETILVELDATESLKRVAVEQFKRVAAAHGFMRSKSGSRKPVPPGVAIRRLFASTRKTLYPQLFVMLLSGPMVNKAPDAIEDLLFSVFEYSAESATNMVHDFSQPWPQGLDMPSSGEYDRQTSRIGTSDDLTGRMRSEGQGDDGASEAEPRAIFLSRFVKECLPDVLPDLLREMRVPVLFEVARRLYYNMPDEGLVRRLIIDNYDAWIVDLVQMLAQDQLKVSPNHATPSQSNQEPSGRDAWRRILEFCEFSIQEMLNLGRKTILSRIAFRLVDASGQPDEVAKSMLTLLAMYASSSKMSISRSATAASDAPLLGAAEKSEKQATTPSNEDLLLTFVRQEFMYMMSVLSEYIGERWRSGAQRAHALQCASLLLEKLGQQEIDPFLIKVLPTAKAALQDENPEVQLRACELMHKLVRLLSDGALRKNLSNVVVSILPCLQPPDRVVALHGTEEESPNTIRNVAQERAVATIHWLVVEKRECLGPVLGDIAELIPRRHPALSEVRQVLEAERGPANLLDRLRQLVELIKHESDNVRLLALSELRVVIADNASNLHKVLLDKSILSESASPHAPDELKMETNENDRKGGVTQLVSELVGTLLRLSRSGAAGSAADAMRAAQRATREVRLACGNCLGELGAIDPSRLDLDIVHAALTGARRPQTRAQKRLQPSKNTRFELDMGNENLAVHIIETYLVVALRAAPDPNSHMQVGMAIQELLSYFRDKKGYVLGDVDGPSQRSSASSRYLVMRELLSAPTMAIVRPFWDTSYAFVRGSDEVPRPHGRGGKSFFGPEVTFETSVGEWFAYLTAHCEGEQAHIFKAMRVLCTYHGATDLLQFLLPYAVQNVLYHARGGDLENDGDLGTQVRREIMEVLRDTWRGESCPGDDDGEIDAQWLASAGYPSEQEHHQEGKRASDSNNSNRLQSSNQAANAASGAASGYRGQSQSSQGSLGTHGSSARVQAKRDISGRIRRNAHAMFSLLDTLATWEKHMSIFLADQKAHAESAESASSSRSSTSSLRSRVEYLGDFSSKRLISQLLRRIPLRCLAEAAYRCGAVARSLRYMELHVRKTHAYDESGAGVSQGAWLSSRPVQFERDEITFLHRIYAALEQDPDGLLSVIAIRARHDGGPGTGFVLNRTRHTVSQWPVKSTPTSRRRPKQRRHHSRIRNPELQAPPGTHSGDGGQPTLLERVFELEFSGRWDEAVSCYERMLEKLRGVTKVDTDTTMMEMAAPASAAASANATGALSHAAKRQRNDIAPHFTNSVDAQVMARRMQLHQGQLSCLRRLNHLDLLVSIGDVDRNVCDESSVAGRPFCKEAMWRLSRWDDLARVLEKERFGDDGAQGATNDDDLELVLLNSGPGNMGSAYTDAVSRAMLALARSSSFSSAPTSSSSSSSSSFPSPAIQVPEVGLRQEFVKQIDRAKLQIMDFLSAVSTESYGRAYPLLLRLHALTELTTGWDVVHLAKRHRNRGVIGAVQNQDVRETSEPASAENAAAAAASAAPSAAVANAVGTSAFDLVASRSQIRRSLVDRGWEDRFKITAPSIEMRKELFEMRRVVFELSGLRADEMHGWLSLAKSARLAEDRQGCLEALQRVQECADDLLVSARSPRPDGKGTVFESNKEEAEVAQLKAKLQMAELYIQSSASSSGSSMLQLGGVSGPGAGVGSSSSGGVTGAAAHHRALMVLEPVQVDLEELEKATDQAPSMLRKTRAKALLMATNMMVESGQGMGEIIVQRYRSVLKQRPDWQRGHFHLARFFEYLMLKLEQSENSGGNRGGNGNSRGGMSAGSALALPSDRNEQEYRMQESQVLLLSVIRQYGKSLEHGGYDHIYESLPRLLTLWYDKAERLHPLVHSLNDQRRGSRAGASRSTRVLLSDGQGGGNRRAVEDTVLHGFNRMNTQVRKLGTLLPPYVWYTALPQLVSRMGVENEDVWSITKKILKHIAEAYPAQAFWHIMGVVKSKSVHRRERARILCQDLVDSPSSATHRWVRLSEDRHEVTMKTQFQNVSQVFDALVKIAKHKPRLLSEIQIDGRRGAAPGDPRRETKLKITNSGLLDGKKLCKRMQRCNLVVPTQAALTPTLPVAAKAKYRVRPSGPQQQRGQTRGAAAENASVTSIESPPSVVPGRESVSGRSSGAAGSDAPQVFGRQCPMMFQLHEIADIMSSKAAPKKIKVYGHNKESYNFLCKNEERGDLRKDARMMEFNTVVNRLFQRDPQARRRKLQLRTYAVVCLNESCGLLEWVENTTALRHTIQCVYKEEGIQSSLHVTWKEGRLDQERLQRCKDDPETKVRKWEEIRKRFPPLLHRWFINHFSGPEAWLSARSQFTRSCSAWSMIGHIVGLGDRHAENVLINTRTGECVHVDFDCLFDKGLTLQIPEVVPFRLTPQMVDGMDLGGAEGGFRTNAEVCLHVMRTHKPMLMSVLESFVVDPLVEWKRVKQTQGGNNLPAASGSNEVDQGKRAAQDKINAISERLDGIVRERKADLGRPDRSSDQVFELLPMSVQSQVHRLIREATDPLKLLSMYSGWAAFL